MRINNLRSNELAVILHALRQDLRNDERYYDIFKEEAEVVENLIENFSNYYAKQLEKEIDHVQLDETPKDEDK